MSKYESIMGQEGFLSRIMVESRGMLCERDGEIVVFAGRGRPERDMLERPIDACI